MRSLRSLLGWLGASLILVSPAVARGPVAHTYFEPHPEEDLAFNAQVAGGEMPAALDTPSGTVQAPDVERSPDKSETVYGGPSTASDQDSTYRIDSDTSRPDLVSYDDPFIPAVMPFKRLVAYDAVDSQLELVVHDKRLEPLPIGGKVASGDDQFYGDIVVDLADDTPVRIPSVGPGARVLGATTRPAVKFELLRDGADNWFIRGASRQRVRLVVQLAIPRAVFGSDYPDVGFGALGPVPALPPEAQVAASEVLARLGIGRGQGPRSALRQLVQHFRAFSPSTARPRSTGVQLYKELALDQKGVCRHRAYAFVITARALGIPTRMVRNEAHAWVEVFDGKLWHRIDLGGAAGNMQTEHDPSQPLHQPPEDPYQWPEGSESGQEMVTRALGAGQPGGGAGSGSGASSSAPGQPPAPTTAPSAGPAATIDAGATDPSAPIEPGQQPEPPADEPPDERPPARVTVSVKTGTARRGEPLPVQGRVEADGQGCANVRVDFALRASDGRTIPIQSLPANADGTYRGALVVWSGVDVGDYELVVSTHGNARCGKGESR